MARTLEQWLDYQQQVHPKSIDMGLERVGEVARRLGLGRPARRVITVGGTNGKGSTVAFIEAIARAAGLKVGAYTSPHLLRYNDRVRIDGADAGDAALVAAFERIEAARGDTPLTYFEFGTLAALLLFEAAGLDLAVLEVGLGGRLDATNIIDPDCAVITTVDLDHQDYLGDDRESIGFEKAGILRAGKPCVLAEKDPPSSVLRQIRREATKTRLGRSGSMAMKAIQGRAPVSLGPMFCAQPSELRKRLTRMNCDEVKKCRASLGSMAQKPPSPPVVSKKPSADPSEVSQVPLSCMPPP